MRSAPALGRDDRQKNVRVCVCECEKKQRRAKNIQSPLRTEYYRRQGNGSIEPRGETATMMNRCRTQVPPVPFAWGPCPGDGRHAASQSLTPVNATKLHSSKLIHPPTSGCSRLWLFWLDAAENQGAFFLNRHYEKHPRQSVRTIPSSRLRLDNGLRTPSRLRLTAVRVLS